MRGDAGLLADQGVSTIGANQKARRDGFVAGKLHLDRICFGGKARNRRRAQLHAERFCLFRKRINKVTILDHMRERFAPFHLAAESQKRRTHRVIEL